MPRVRDVALSILDLHRFTEPGEVVELFTLDFSDAFKLLHVDQRERKYLTGEALGGHFAYRTVLFGVGSGLLVWGRLAAWAMRCTQSLYPSTVVRVNRFVDDPVLVIRGAAAACRKIATVVAVRLVSPGLRIAYHEGQVAGKVEWIGALLASDPVAKGVHVTIPEQKLSDIRALLEERMGGRGVLPAARLRTLAGKLGWVASLLPQLRPFVSRVWAALSEGGGRDLIFKRQAVHEIAKKLAMILAPMGRELLGLHIWGERHVLADALSAGRPRPRGQTAWRYLRKECPK